MSHLGRELIPLTARHLACTSVPKLCTFSETERPRSPCYNRVIQLSSSDKKAIITRLWDPIVLGSLIWSMFFGRCCRNRSLLSEKLPDDTLG